MKTSFRCLIIPAIFAVTATVNAATLTFSDAINFTNTQSLGTNIITLNQFDDLSGARILTGVTLTVTMTVPSQVLRLDNDSDGTAFGNYNFLQAGNTFWSESVSTFDGSTTIGTGNFGFTTQTASYNLSADTGTENASGMDIQPGEGDYFEFSTTPVTLGVVGRDISSFVWAGYTGTGSISFDLAKAFATNLTDNTLNGSGVLEQNQTLATGTMFTEVTYEYTPVPEPSTYAALFGLAALGLVAFRRRQ